MLATLCEVSDCNENHNDASVSGSRSLSVQSMVWILRLSMVPILPLRLPLVGTLRMKRYPPPLFLPPNLEGSCSTLR